MTRFTKRSGIVTRQVCTEVPTETWRILRYSAHRHGVSLQEYLRQVLAPTVEKIKSEHPVPTSFV